MSQQISSELTALPESQKSAALVRLAGKLAHELNNIFTTVIGNVALLDEAKIPGVETAIKELRRGIERGIELSSNLQAFAGTQAFRRRHVEVNRVIEETVHPLRQSLLSGFDLEINLSRPSCIVFIDEEKFRACLFEIARNASRSMRGLGTLTIETRPIREGKSIHAACDEPDEIEIDITDTGIGMAPEVVEHALDPMFTTQTPQVSPGWGLSKVAGFVRQSGGQMKLRSVPDVGTSVSLRLPVVAICGE